MTYAQATFLLSLFGPPLLYLTGYGIYRWAWGNGWDSHERYMSSEAAKVLREERLKDSGAEVRRSSRESAPASVPELTLYDADLDFTLPQPQFKLGLPLALDLGIVAAVADDPTLSAHYGIQAEMLARSVRKVASR